MRQQRYFEQFRPRTPERKYLGGETHLYLGRQYRLKRINAEREEVKLRSGQLCVLAPSGTDPDRVRALVQGWYRGRAGVKLREI